VSLYNSRVIKLQSNTRLCFTAVTAALYVHLFITAQTLIKITLKCVPSISAQRECELTPYPREKHDENMPATRP